MSKVIKIDRVNRYADNVKPLGVHQGVVYTGIRALAIYAYDYLNWWYSGPPIHHANIPTMAAVDQIYVEHQPLWILGWKYGKWRDKLESTVSRVLSLLSWPAPIWAMSAVYIKGWKYLHNKHWVNGIDKNSPLYDPKVHNSCPKRVVITATGDVYQVYMLTYEIQRALWLSLRRSGKLTVGWDVYGIVVLNEDGSERSW